MLKKRIAILFFALAFAVCLFSSIAASAEDKNEVSESEAETITVEAMQLTTERYTEAAAGTAHLVDESRAVKLNISAVDAEYNPISGVNFRIGFEKTVIFLIVPAAKKTYKVIANLFYSQLFSELMRVAEEQPNGRLKYLVSLEIDEFANIGKIPDFPEILAVIRKYNIRACIVLQGLAQLKSIYEKTWESIIGNCDIFTFLGSKDADTKKYVSEKLGNTTVRVDQRSYNRGMNQGGGESQTVGGEDMETEVMLPDFGDGQEQRPIGIWGCGCPVDISAEGRSTDRVGRRDQRHLRYIREHRIAL